MKRKLLTLLAPCALILSFAFGLTIAPAVSADSDCPETDDASELNLSSGIKCAKGEGTPTNLFGGQGIFNIIVNVLLFLVGIISVVMLIYGGVKYSTSSGDQARVTSAKNTIMYAIVGLIVSILAFAIVNFITGSIKEDGGGAGGGGGAEG